MSLSPKERDAIRRAFGELARCVMYAADPHCDCRDEMMGILDAMEEDLQEQLDDDDQGDAPTAVAGDDVGEKGGGA